MATKKYPTSSDSETMDNLCSATAARRPRQMSGPSSPVASARVIGILTAWTPLWLSLQFSRTGDALSILKR